jgi:hypothetical protein
MELFSLKRYAFNVKRSLSVVLLNDNKRKDSNGKSRNAKFHVNINLLVPRHYLSDIILELKIKKKKK